MDPASAIVITGRGVVSPWGVGAERFGEGLTAARRVVAPLPSTDDESAWTIETAQVSDFPLTEIFSSTKGLRECDRTSLLLCAAASMAIRDDGLSVHERESTGLAVGSTFGSISSIADFDQQIVRETPMYVSPLAFPNTVLNAPTARVALQFGMRGINATISTGETSGLDALIYGGEWLLAGRSQSFLAGSGFGLSATLRGSFRTPMGEGAAMFMLRVSEREAGEGLHSYARLAGFHTVFLPLHGDSLRLASAAIRRALESSEKGVDLVIASGRGPRHCPDLEREALEHVLGETPPPIKTLNDLIGDCLDATGAFQIAAALHEIERGAGSVLISSFSRAGNAAFVVLSRENSRD